MKKTSLLAIVVCLFAILAFSASAQLTVSDLTLGSSDQNREESVSGTLTVTNTDAAKTFTLGSITYAKETKYSDAKYMHTVTATLPTDLVLSPGESGTISVSAVVPLNLDAIDASLVGTSFKTGAFTLTATDGTTPVSVSKDLKMQAKNELKFRKGKVTLQSEGATPSEKTFRDGNTVKDIKPGDKLNLEFEIENNFPSSGTRETDFDDVLVGITLTNENDFDLDDDEDSFSISAGDTETAKFSLTVEEDAKDRKSTVEAKISGLDENGAKHGQNIRVSLDITRDNHDVVVRKIDLSPSRIACGASRSVQVSTSLLNRGKIDEDEAGVEVRVSDLNLFERKTGLSLDQDDSASATVSLTVPESAKAGTYNVDVVSLYDTTVKNNVRNAQLTVEECKKSEAVVPVTTVVVPSNVVTQPAQSTTQTAVVKPARVSSMSDSNTYLIVLGVAIAVVVVLIVALLAVLVRRR